MSIVTAPAGICNLAFDLLRQKEPVVNLDTPESDLEGLASRWYDTVRRAVLGAYYWNFARKRKALSLNATSPEFGFANAYNLPNDYLALVFIGDQRNYFYETEYTIENGQILIDNNGGATLNIGYIYDHTDVAKFDPLFVRLLVAELALMFANSITGLNKGMKSIEKLKKELQIAARAKNGHDNPPKRREVSKIIAKRRLITQGGTTDGIHLFP
jgi:hypothetical protein